MLTGLAVAAGVLAVTAALGLWWRRSRNRISPATRETAPIDPALLAALGVESGPSVTLLQFSSAFCAPCRATRVVCAEVAALLDGVKHVEVDAESHLEAVRALGIWRTPTVLILDKIRPGRAARDRGAGQGPGDRGRRAAAAHGGAAVSAVVGKPVLLDPRGPRFAAALTTVVLVVVLATGSGWLALAQAAVFALTVSGPRRGPYGMLYRALVAPRLRPPTELEPAEPVRFAQMIGLVCMLIAAAGFLLGAPLVGYVATGAALAAAFLNAAFGLCLGCEVYLAYRRLTGRTVPTRVPAPAGGGSGGLAGA